jgi:hypothetical protein
MSRATGQKWLDLPALRENWRFALYLGLPGAPYAFDMNDGHTARESVSVSNYGMLWDEASAFKCGEGRTAADLFNAREPDNDYPAANFLWFDPAIEPVPLEKIKPYYHFKDHGVVSWRSGWDQGATCYAFRCGPPLGHKALAKTTQLKDWLMNCGHVHADIGSFWMYAKGAYLATDTGYTAEKWTRDQNTLLVDGQGQAMDGSYWNDRGFPYEKLNAARIDRVHFCADYGFASGELGSVYDRVAPGLQLRRSLLMTKRWLLVVDDLVGAAEHKLTWLCHADAEFKAEGPAFVARLAKAALAVLPLGVAATEPKMETTTVMAGTGPGQGKATERGYHLALTMKEPAKAARLVNLLIPLAPDEKLPEVKTGVLEGDTIAFSLAWPEGKTETVTLNLKLRPGTAAEQRAIIRAP